MPTDIQITATPIEMRIGKHILKAKTLRDRDQIELDQYVRNKIIQSAHDYIKAADFLPKDDREEVIAAAVKTAATTFWYEEIGTQVLRGIEGTAIVGYQMIKGQHNLTFKEFLSMVKDKQTPDEIAANLDNIRKAFVELNVDPEEEEKEEAVQEESGTAPK